MGRCPDCGEWNTLVEQVVVEAKPTAQGAVRASRAAVTATAARMADDPIPLSAIVGSEGERLSTGLAECDRVLGGGLMPGSITLVGGDPGIGKSTLMLQIVPGLAPNRILYIAGEESPRQVKLRADRLGVTGEHLLLLPETNIDAILGTAERLQPEVMIVDSIQTVYRPEIESAPGSVSQVRESCAALTRLAKNGGVSIFLIGHVTKEGAIAGPRVLEHMVDTVLQFEGDRHHSYRVLRAVKNRFGSTNEIGIFEMREEGLREVTNPSEVFLSERSYGVSGSTVVASLEGSRPLLLEIQALVAPTSYPQPQRTAAGFDPRRLQLLLAVLEKRLDLKLGTRDTFINVAGGVKIDEPAADLAVMVAVVSSLKDIPADSKTVVVGEVGLGGEVRTVSQIERRIQEAAKLGFERIVVPKGNLKGLKPSKTIQVIGVERVGQALTHLLG